MRPSTTRRLGVAALALLTVTAGCSGLADLAPGGTDPAFESTGLDSVRTFGPECGDPRSKNVSSYSRPVPGGRKLSINSTIPVRSNATRLEADLDEVGPHRYHLAIERTTAADAEGDGGTGADAEADPDAGCYLETRYNATVNLTDEVVDRYTLLVTYDGVLVSGYYADPDGSGASSGLAPASRHSPWVRNATDRQPDDGDGAAGGDGGDAAGGSSGGAGGGSAPSHLSGFSPSGGP